MIQAPQIVNGYLCFDCADVALAKKGDNPAHPPGSPSNPTGATPNGPNAPQASGASSGAPGTSHNSPAVVLGGSLASLTPAAGASVAASTPYQAGAQVNVLA